MFDSLITQVRGCHLCVDALPLGPNPVIQVHQDAKLLIIGQAPGIKVHQTSIPWNDASGNRLRDWLGISKDVFYDAQQVAIVPMGFCYPGKGHSGDLPPRKECAPMWHDKLFAELTQIELTLYIGQYAQRYYLPGQSQTLTETVKQWRIYDSKVIPLPHPSPRNNLWLRKNPWFEMQVIPVLRDRVRTLLKHP